MCCLRNAVQAAGLLFVLILAAGAIAAEVLPVGDAPLPLAAEHFPSRLHALVWRNWFLVDTERLASTVGASPENLRDLAEGMGLPRRPAVSPEWKKRGYITIIRRNWHLLPYEQLLSLLDMKADDLAFILREDDVLYIKLGNHKPKCEPVKWIERTGDIRAAEARVRAAWSMHLAPEWWLRSEPPFEFIRKLSQTSSPPPAEASPADSPPLPNDVAKHPRYIYSYFGCFGDPLLDEQLDPYPDGLLEKLAQSGANGVWLHVVLRQLAGGGEAFPEFGKDREKRLANLRRLVARAKWYGLAVYLYINEPRAMPLSFFERRSEMKGVAEGEFATLCTSDPRVRKWLGDALAEVFNAVPDLGGVFTITASENLTSCASHGQSKHCPHCRDRDPDEIIAEVISAIEQGVHRASPKARVIAWDWGWHNHGDATSLIARLPKNVWLESVSEWNLPIERGGIKTEVGEYSLSAVGPGPRAIAHWKAAKDRELSTLAKMQLNCTWELSAVPSLPVLDLVAEHCERLAKEKVDGQMLSWSLGGYPSLNLGVAREFAIDPAAKKDEVLHRLARVHYGPDASPQVRAAWTAFSQAFREYPYHISGLYSGPQQQGPANLLHLTPTGRRASMVGFPYDDLDTWRFPYPAKVYADQMEKVARGFEGGLALLAPRAGRPAVRSPSPQQAIFLARLAEDYTVDEAAWCHLASVANQARFILVRQQWLEAAAPSEQKSFAAAKLRAILDGEMDLAKTLLDDVNRDSRIGFEASNQYYYVPSDLVEKIISCEYLKNQLTTAAAK